MKTDISRLNRKVEYEPHVYPGHEEGFIQSFSHSPPLLETHSLANQKHHPCTMSKKLLVGIFCT